MLTECPCSSACCLAWLCAFLAANWHPLFLFLFVPAHSPNQHGTHVVPPTRGRPHVASSPCNLGAYVGTVSRWAVRALVCCTLSNALTLGTLVVTVTLSDGPFYTVSSAPIPGPRSWCCCHSPTHSAYRRERSTIRRSAGPASSTSALVVTRVTPACREWALGNPAAPAGHPVRYACSIASGGMRGRSSSGSGALCGCYPSFRCPSTWPPAFWRRPRHNCN